MKDVLHDEIATIPVKIECGPTLPHAHSHVPLIKIS
jgi:hypothetical protein